MAVYDGPGAVEDVSVGTLRKKSVGGQIDVPRTFFSQRRRTLVMAEKSDSLKDVLDDAEVTADGDEVYSPPRSTNGTGGRVCQESGTQSQSH